MAEITGTDNPDTLNGTEEDDTLRGLGADDTINGNGGDDFLDGGTGNDLLRGGSGFDTYLVDNFRDVVEENAGESLVISSSNFNLSNNFNGRFTLGTSNAAGTDPIELTGGRSADSIYGNAGNNRLEGSGGSDYLVGLGGDDFMYGLDPPIFDEDDLSDIGTRQDILAGGTGNDSYLVDLLDQIYEADGEGDDIARILNGGSYTLRPGASVETLGAEDPNSQQTFSVIGNEFGQSIYGTSAGNTLEGRAGNDQLIGLGGNDFLDGGEGVDVLRGGTGNDTYVVDDPRDQVFEQIANNFDRVLAIVSYTLAPGVEVESLSADSIFGTDPLNFRGNEVAQSLIGNDGNNFLDGGGGADQMTGRLGNDTYVVDRSGDVINELAGEGDDILLASASYTLAGAVSVETMAASDGITAIELRGNELGQSLYGNAGANFLDGRSGADFLVGRGGADLFAFTTAPGSGNVDAIGDMQSGVDKIGVDNAVFLGLDGGALPASAFVTGTSAQDADDRIIHDPITGALFFDADGNGAGAAVQFASVTPGLPLSASDFVVL